MKKITKVVKYRRKREGRTDYRKRLKMLVSGIPRLVIRRTNKNMIVQVVEYSENGDHVIVTTNSIELRKLGWKHGTGNLPAAYLTGMLAAQKSKKKHVVKAIVDLGLQPKSCSRLYAAVKGAKDNGLDVPASEEVFPSADRLSGKHIADYGAKSKHFKISPVDIEKSFNDLKQKLMK